MDKSQQFPSSCYLVERFTAAPQHGLLILFPSMVAELFRPVFHPGRPHLLAILSQRDPLLLEFGGRQVFPFLFFFKEILC